MKTIKNLTADELRKSILQLAIQGKLVKQNPNDEPASVLVDKIYEEKKKLIAEGKIKKEKEESRIFKGDDNRYYEKIGKKEPVDITDDLPFDIPDSWEWIRLKNIVKINTGNKDANYGDISGKYDFFTCALIPIKSKTFSFDGTSLILPGNGANVGISIFYQGKFEAYQRTYVLQNILDENNLKYLDIELNCRWKKYNQDKLYGSAIPYIKLGNIENYLLPLPPLEEQKRIVEKIGELEPYIKKYDNLEKQLTKLENEITDKLKKSILQYAIQGKLVKQDSNDEPASVLLERIKAEKEKLIKEGKIKRDKNESFIYQGDDKNYYENINGKVVNITDEIPFDIPDNWCWIRIKNILSSIQYGYNAPAKHTGNIKLLRISDIQNNNVNWNSVPYCDINNEMFNIYKVSNKDIFIARTGGTIGKSYLLNQQIKNCVFAGYLIRFQLINKELAYFVNYFLNSPCYWSQVTKGSMGTGQPNINGVTLGNLLIPITQQHTIYNIVIRLEKIFQTIDLF